MFSSNFYEKLPIHSIPLVEMFENEHLFNKIPNSWQIIVVNVKPQKPSLSENRFKDINLYVTGIITTVLNTLKKSQIKIHAPYFYGGNEVTFIIPYNILTEVKQALYIYKCHLEKATEFKLDYGSLPVKQVYNHKKLLKIARLEVNSYLITPIILGNGLKYARSKIVSGFHESDTALTSNDKPNLDGMKCRWQDITINDPNSKVICLFIESTKEKNQAKLYRKILGEIKFVFGNYDDRNPITTTNLKLDHSIKKFRYEMMARVGIENPNYSYSNWLIMLFGSHYFKFFSKGKRYLYRVTQLSDTLKIDGSLSTIIKGNQNQISKLTAILDELESRSLISYGIHASQGALISCYVQDRNKNHIHFIDGTNGGQSSAKMFCRKKLMRKRLNYA